MERYVEARYGKAKALSIRFAPLAVSDLRTAFEHYEGKREGLGFEFMAAVRKAVDRIEANPLIFPVRIENVRRAGIGSKFPYSLWYVQDGDSIIVAALHNRMDTAFALKRSRMLDP